jgi:hypothetical protein
MLGGEPDRAERCRARSQAISHGKGRRDATLLQQFHHQFPGDLGVSSTLDQEIEHLTLIVDRPPEPITIAADRDRRFVEVPMITRSWQ